MPEIDEFEKMASNFIVEFSYRKDEVDFIGLFSKYLRNIAENHEKIGWNNAVEECALYVEGRRYEINHGNDYADDVSDAIRRLIKE